VCRLRGGPETPPFARSPGCRACASPTGSVSAGMRRRRSPGVFCRPVIEPKRAVRNAPRCAGARPIPCSAAPSRRRSTSGGRRQRENHRFARPDIAGFLTGSLKPELAETTVMASSEDGARASEARRQAERVFQPRGVRQPRRLRRKKDELFARTVFDLTDTCASGASNLQVPLVRPQDAH
jgi:hypothetical protein